MPMQDPRLTRANVTSLVQEVMLRVVGELSLAQHLFITDRIVESGPSTYTNLAQPLPPPPSRPLPHPPPQPLLRPPRHQLPTAGLTFNAEPTPSNEP
jgi:hypothetical protein